MHAPVIRLSDVTYRWPGQERAVLDIPTLDVAPNERLFLHGPSGSGKTTILNLLAGVSKPDSGEMQVMGKPLSASSRGERDRFRADHIGLIFQMFNLVPYLSIVENVLLPCRFSALRKQRAVAGDGDLLNAARRLLRHVGMDGAEHQDRPVSKLSVGQQQRVAAARALIGAPELIIADEPTSSLDETARSAFLDLLFAEVDETGATLLFVSHDRRLETRFGRVVALADINRAASIAGEGAMP